MPPSKNHSLKDTPNAHGVHFLPLSPSSQTHKMARLPWLAIRYSFLVSSNKSRPSLSNDSVVIHKSCASVRKSTNAWAS